jgi:hypothetical protein
MSGKDALCTFPKQAKKWKPQKVGGHVPSGAGLRTPGPNSSRDSSHCSMGGTRLATLRSVNTSPGWTLMIVSGETRESQQAMTKTCQKSKECKVVNQTSLQPRPQLSNKPHHEQAQQVGIILDLSSGLSTKNIHYQGRRRIGPGVDHGPRLKSMPWALTLSSLAWDE